MMSSIKELGIIIVAGGSSARYGKTNKLLEKLKGIPVFAHSVKNFLNVVSEDQLILVVPEKEKELFNNEMKKRFNHNVKIVIGGKTRLESVYNGLKAIADKKKFIAVHDAARPLASSELLTNLLKASKKFGNAVAAKRLTDTIKRTTKKNKVIETVDRENLWVVETPQLFKADALMSSYERAIHEKKKDFTDDAGIMEANGEEVYLYENLECNIKITYPGDLTLAEFWLARKTKKKIAFLMEKSVLKP